MSRIPTDGTDKTNLADDIPLLAITTIIASTDETEQEDKI